MSGYILKSERLWGGLCPVIRLKLIVGVLIGAVLCSFNHMQAATFTSKTSGGAWNNAGTWDGGVVPATNLTSGNVVIKGYVTLSGSLTLDGGILEVIDTLVVRGDLNMPNTNGISLKVGPKAVFVILGNYTSKNKVMVENGGSIVIGGTINSNGSKADYTGEAGSAIYAVGGGSAYSMPACTVPGPGCIGNGLQLSQTSLGQFYASLTAGYSLSVNSTCFTNTGTPVNLSFSPVPPANGAINSIKWFRDGAPVHGWESVSSITEWTAGSYSASYVLASDGKTYWAKGIAVLGGTSAITGNKSVLAGSENTYSIGNVANATYYRWSVPAGSAIKSGQGTPSIVVIAGAQVGNITVTPTNGSSSGCSSSLMVNIRDASCDCSTTGAYWSKNNYTGVWSDANSWGNANNASTPLPPPTDGTSNGNSQTLCISGYITLNGNYKITTSNQTICDTLVITGDLLAQNPSLTVQPGGVLIVLGNYVGASGTINNNGRVIFAGELTQPYNFSGSGTFYSFDPSPNVPVWFGTSLYSQAQLAVKDPALFDFYNSIACGTGVSGGSIGNDQALCTGADVAAFISKAEASPLGGISYQWYSSVNSSNPASGTWNIINGATSNTYDHGTLSVNTYFYRKATKGGGCSANSNVITVTVTPAPVTGDLYRKPNN